MQESEHAHVTVIATKEKLLGCNRRAALQNNSGFNRTTRFVFPHHCTGCCIERVHIAVSAAGLLRAGLLRKREMFSICKGSSPAANVNNFAVGAQSTRSSNFSASLKRPNDLRFIRCSEKRRWKRKSHGCHDYNKCCDATSYAYCRLHLRL